jgi:ankyrin repeat protein
MGNINTLFEFKIDLFRQADSHGNTQRMEELLANGVLHCSVIRQGTWHVGETLLHLVYSPEAVQLLLRYGADPNANGTFNNPLHCARSPQVANALIQGGADVNALDKGGYSALVLAATSKREGTREMLELFLRHNPRYETEGFTILHEVAALGDVRKARMLLEHDWRALLFSRTDEQQRPVDVAGENEQDQAMYNFLVQREFAELLLVMLAVRGSEDGGPLAHLPTEIFRMLGVF